MQVSFHYSRKRLFYAMRFQAGAFECVPLLTEVRFWGVDRLPCPQLSTLAALIVLKNHPVKAVTLPDQPISPAVCTALCHHFGVDIRPADYDIDRRALAGGEKTAVPVRFRRMREQFAVQRDAEILTWISLDDLGGPFGGHVRTNLDAFDLAESSKDLIVALCCAGMDVGHIVLKDAEPGTAEVLHRIGLELIDAADAA